MTKVEHLGFTFVADTRGLLAAAQHPGNLPFSPVRIFIVTQSPAGTERGGHAHRQCHQVLVATAGSILVEYDDDEGTRTTILEGATQGIHIPPLAWAKQTYLTDGASLVVLASHPYDVDDYIDDREEAARLRRTTPNSPKF